MVKLFWSLTSADFSRSIAHSQGAANTVSLQIKAIAMNKDTKTLDLRNLSESPAGSSERDTRINEAVAVMDGWVLAETKGYGFPVWQKPVGVVHQSFPPYATSCDAVMPLLEKAFLAFQWNAADRSFGYLSREGDMWKWTFGSVPLEQGAFCLAACIALLRANGVEVLL